MNYECLVYHSDGNIYRKISCNHPKEITLCNNCFPYGYKLELVQDLNTSNKIDATKTKSNYNFYNDDYKFKPLNTRSIYSKQQNTKSCLMM